MRLPLPIGVARDVAQILLLTGRTVEPEVFVTWMAERAKAERDAAAEARLPHNSF